MDIEDIVNNLNTNEIINEHCANCNSLANKKMYNDLTSSNLNHKVLFFIEFVIVDQTLNENCVSAKTPLVYLEESTRYAEQ